jgi:hypothetical protein
MEFLGDPVPYHRVMGVSGSAFKLIWHRSWCPSNNTLLVLGLAPVKRAFRAMGYGYEFIPRAKTAEPEFRRRIVESIRQGRPVLAEGIVGPPELGIIAGFDDNGNVLLGRSFFHDSREYYRKVDWYKDCHSLLLIGEKTAAPSRLEILRQALEWAVQLVRTPEMEWPGPQRVLGLAAYDEWAAALRRDEDFPRDDLKALTPKCTVNKGVTLSGLIDARKAARAFLQDMVDVAPAAADELLAAAEAYEMEARVLTEAFKAAPDCTDPPANRLRMADPQLRAAMAETVLRAKELDAQAVEHLECAQGRLQ